MPRELHDPFAERKRLQKKRDELKQHLIELTQSERSWLDEHAPALESGDASTRDEFARREEVKYGANVELGHTEWLLGNTPGALTNLKAAYDYGSAEQRAQVVDVLRDIQTKTGLQLLRAADLKPGDNVATE
jgi:ferric-dicitrate binding protein FerR (iron transport regulator)